MNQQRTERQRGASFLEFLMVAPVLLLICGSTVELANFIRFRQIADVVSKEAAMRAYRDCDITRVNQINGTSTGSNGPTVDKVSTQDAILECLTDVRNNINTALSGTTIQGTVILSVYRFQPGELVPFRAGDANPLNRPLCSTSTSATNAVQAISTDSAGSNYVPSGGAVVYRSNSGAGNVAPWGCDTGRVFIAEAVFTYTPIIGFRVFGIGNSFDVDFANSPLNGTFRETAIL